MSRIESQADIPAYADQGDSGGPLACPGQDDDVFLAGVAHNAAPVEQYGYLFTSNNYYRTAAYLDWIKSHIAKDNSGDDTTTSGDATTTPSVDGQGSASTPRPALSLVAAVCGLAAGTAVMGACGT